MARSFSETACQPNPGLSRLHSLPLMVLNTVLCSSATDTVSCSSQGQKIPTKIHMQQNHGHARTAPMGQASSFSSPESPPVYLPLCISLPSHTLFICFPLLSSLH